MTLCSVVDCKNIGNHIFPKDANRRKQWIKALRRKNWQPSNYSRLCAAHFKPEDFYERNSYTGDENKHKVLKKTAVPSIFSFTKVKPENQQRLNRRLERSRRRLCLETAPGPSGIQAENNDLFTSIMSEIPQKRAKTSVKECRACLANIDDDLCCDIFRAWDPVWLGMGISIAQDLSKLTNVQIDTSDPYSKDICTKCCLRLKDSINFIMTVQNSDQALRQRHRSSVDEKPLWPKPIQVDKNITSNPFNDVSIEVKQEVLTDDEYEMNDTWSEPCEPRLDIKIEPEEITPAIPTSMIEINGPYSMLQSPEKKSKPNGATEYLDELVLADLKEEPMSEDEAQPATEMPKECMLCFKSFKTVKGLKSHVIAVHSYDTVTPPRLDRTNVCATCNISFTTRTDLFVHEACHGPGRKFTCYICDKKFDTYLLLTKHKSKRCTKTGVLPRLKTLDDVRRPIYIIRDTNKAITIEKSTPERKSPTSQHIDTTETDPSSVGPDLVLEGVKSGDNGLAHDVQPIEPSTGLNLSDNKELVPNEQYESTETAPEETNSSKDEKKSNMNTLSEENSLQADNTINITCVIDETYRFKTNKRKIKQNNEICQKSINTEVIDSDRCEKENSEQKQNAIVTAYIHEDNVELESKVDITKDNGSEVCSKTKENKSDAGHELDEKLPGVTTIENNTSEDSKVSDNKEKLHQTIAIERDEIEESIQLKVLKNCVNDKVEIINSEETDNKKIKQNETKDTETIFNETRDNEIKVCETIGSEPMLHKEQWHEC